MVAGDLTDFFHLTEGVGTAAIPLGVEVGANG